MGDTSIATDLQEGIEDLVVELGKTGTIRHHPTSIPVDPNKDWLGTSDTPVDTSVEVLILDYSTREIDGTNVQAGDKKALVSLKGVAIEPKPTDRFFDVYPVPMPEPASWRVESVT